MIKTLIGTWHEREARKITFCPSYYAADWQTILTTPGDYPAHLSWNLMGFTCPMPEDMHVLLPAQTIAGELNSGFGGVNFASTDIEPGPTWYGWTAYTYQIAKLVADGLVTLDPEWSWLTLPDHGCIAYASEHWTREMVRERAVS